MQARWAGPAAGWRLDHGKREQGQCSGKGDGTSHVQTRRIWITGFPHPERTERQGEDRNHRRRQEDRTPTECLGYVTRKERTESQPDTEGRAKQAECTSPGVTVELLGERCRATSQGGGSGDPLKCSQQVQEVDRKRETQGERTCGEQDKPN
jgi:hypothetical protein